MSADKLAEELAKESSDREQFRAILTKPLDVNSNGKERSLTKTTKLVNRLKKIFTEPSISSWIDDLAKIDVSMYVEEVVSALMEGYKSMKLRDVPRFAEISCHICNSYPEFGPNLFQVLKKQLEFVMNDNLRLRIHLRTLTEGMLLSFFPRDACLNELTSIFQSVLTSMDKSAQISIVRLTGLSYWLSKYFVLAKADPFVSPLITISLEFYQSGACNSILDSAKQALAAQEKANTYIRIHKGMLDPETEARYTGLKQDFDKISVLVETIRISMELPTFCEEVKEENTTNEEPVEEATPCLQFSDDSEKSLYEDILDLIDRLPKSLLPEKNVEELPSEDPETTDELVVESLHVKIFVGKLENECFTQEEADLLAIYWFEGGFNSKGNRKALAKWLLLSNKQILSPAQGRFIATIAPFASDLVSTIIPYCRKNVFKGDNRIRSIRFLAELAKFKICPPGVILRIFQSLLDDFVPLNGELAAWLLLTCGKYMLNHPEVSESMEALVVRLMKLKESTLNLPQKVKMAIDDAYSQAKPKLVKLRKNIEKSNMEKYIDHLMHVEVYRMDEESILRLVCQLPWEDPKIRNAFQQAVLGKSGVHVNFDKMYSVASLLCGLKKFEGSVVCDLIDATLEEFQLGIEKDDFRSAAQRVRLAKLIAEFYAFRLIDSTVIFDTLYHLIGFRDTSSCGASDLGVLRGLLQEQSCKMGTITEDEEAYMFPMMHAGAVDEPAWSFVRPTLVCTILTACGEFFLRGRALQRLQMFFLFFRRYMWLRQPVPLRVQHIVSDMFEALGVRYRWETDSLEKIQSEIDALGIPTEQMSTDEEIYDEDEEKSESSLVEEIFADDSSCDERRCVADMDQIAFDREMQSLMMDSLAEARTKSVSLNPLLSRPTQSSTKDVPGAFKVLRSGGARTMTVSDSVLVVPETHKLRKGQADYQAEQAAAERERQQVKQYILQYERHAGGPASATLPTLGEKAGIEDFDPLQWSDNRSQKERRRYRKL